MKREPFIPVTNKKSLLGFQLELLGLNMGKIGQIPLWLLQKREPGTPGLSQDGFALANVCLLFQGDPIPILLCPAWWEHAVRGSPGKWAFPCGLALMGSSGEPMELLQVLGAGGSVPWWGVWHHAALHTPPACQTASHHHRLRPSTAEEGFDPLQCAPGAQLLPVLNHRL